MKTQLDFGRDAECIIQQGCDLNCFLMFLVVAARFPLHEGAVNKIKALLLYQVQLHKDTYKFA